MEHMTISEAFSRFLAACGALTIIGGAIALIRRWLDPAFRMRKRVDDLEKCNQVTADLLKEISETNKLLCKSMLVLLDHSITGNGIERIREVKSDLVNYLTDK